LVNSASWQATFSDGTYRLIMVCWL